MIVRQLCLACALLAPALVLAGCSSGGAGPGSDDYYETILLAGSRVGWAHTDRQTVREDGRILVRTHNVSQLTLVRDGEPVTQKMVLTCWETVDGVLVRFETDQDGSAMSARGEVRDGKLIVTRTTSGRSETETHAWKEWGGFFAPTDSLRRKPMQPGEKRAIRSLTPLMNVPATTRLEALTWEQVDLAGGPQELLKVRGTLTLGETDLEMLFWVDKSGEVLKTRLPSIDQESVRVTKEEALRPLERQSFDLLADTVVPLAPPVPDFSAARQVVYRAGLRSGPIAGIFVHGLSQRVRVVGDRQAEITVLGATPDWPQENVPPQQPPDDYREPTTFLQSDDPQVRQIAAAVAAGESDRWQIAVALERHVHDSIRRKDYSQAMASAAEVARSLEGDCTEHAVLLAACLRARDIPARVAFGLVYVPGLGGFAYHMWTEAWIEDRWLPLDATQGRGGIGCDHLKLGDSNLAGGEAYSDILKVVTVLGQLELSVVSSE